MTYQFRFIRLFLFLIFALSLHSKLLATVDGALSGTVLDDQGIAVSGAKVVIKGQGLEKDLTSSATGTFQAFPLIIGNYEVDVTVDGFSPYQGTVAVSGSNSTLDVHLSKGGEMELKVSAKQNLISPSSNSSRDLDKDDIDQLPGGSTENLPKVLYATTAGFVEGDFGQVFTRGNHANLQYQIDGIQLPDSVGGSFGEAFTPVNIDHMEILTGGLAPEFGSRLAGVVNIVTKSGGTDQGGEIGTSYGSYNQTNSYATYGGSDMSGAFHYLLSVNGFSTNRGLDTPAPADINNDQNGGSEQAIHDNAYGSDEFVKLDWQADNKDKLSLVAFSENKFYQIPDYDSSFDPGGSNFAYFSGGPSNMGYTDTFGNGPFNYVPSSTNDTQAESNKYIEFSWLHTFDDSSFIQISPYFKESNLTFTNDPTNDLAYAQNTPLFDSIAGNLYAANGYVTMSNGVPVTVGGIVEDSYSQNRTSDNFGTQVDYTLRPDSNNLFKAGGQALITSASGPISVIEVQNIGNGPATTVGGDASTDYGYQEGVYVQDELTLAKWLVIDGGIRFDATQYVFPDTTQYSTNFGPRIGVSFLPTETTKFHVYYGKLFMPAPPEDLKETFNTLVSGGSVTPYDIKPETDDYFEAGLAQQVGTQLFTVNAYYKAATNMLDESQLLNTDIAQPYNFATGYAYGVEYSMRGKLDKDWSDFGNFTYSIAEGQGIDGGVWAFPPGTNFYPGVYQFLDHCQIYTSNFGLTYNPGDIWITATGLYGGGLSTGPANSERLPGHFTMDTTIGYAFKKGTGLNGLKASLDIINVGDNPYVIFIDNGYNGNHYENGREFVFHLAEAI